MKKRSAVFLCAAFAIASTAGAANVSTPASSKASASAEPLTPVAAKPAKVDAPAPKRGPAAAAAPEALTDPYLTPLLLNAKPLMAGRP